MQSAVPRGTGDICLMGWLCLQGLCMHWQAYILCSVSYARQVIYIATMIIAVIMTVTMTTSHVITRDVLGGFLIVCTLCLACGATPCIALHSWQLLCDGICIAALRCCIIASRQWVTRPDR
jgi:hypothetical protein